ncbi:ATP-binding protein [Isosphaeraceae bacterium EP7]
MDLARQDRAAHPSEGRAESGPPGDFILPSRAAALDACRAAGEERLGPLLLTGAAGVGKSWLWRRMARGFPSFFGVISVDLAPSDTPADLLRAILHALGVDSKVSGGCSRLELHEELSRRSEDGERWLLVLDEAQNGCDFVLEEARLMANRLGEADGFETLLLVGQPHLAHRLRGRSLQGLRNRLGAHQTLGALDIEEAGSLLRSARPGLTWDQGEIDRRHRLASGNPRRLLLLARPGLVAPAGVARLAETVTDEALVARSPWGLSSKPPLRVEDGLIEVGWSSASETATPDAENSERAEPDKAASGHFPAATGWDDWDDEAERESDDAEALYDSEERARKSVATQEPADDGVEAELPLLRAEPQHGYAPYGPLFSRLRPARDAE